MLKRKFRFSLTSMLLLLTLCAVTVGWWLDRVERGKQPLLGSILQPLANEKFKQGEPINVSCVFRTNSQAVPTVVVNLQRPIEGDLLTVDSAALSCKPFAGQANMYSLDCVFAKPTPYPTGKYLLRVTGRDDNRQEQATLLLGLAIEAGNEINLYVCANSSRFGFGVYKREKDGPKTEIKFVSVEELKMEVSKYVNSRLTNNGMESVVVINAEGSVLTRHTETIQAGIGMSDFDGSLYARQIEVRD